MKILLVNDDGVYAPGIKTLKETLESKDKHDVYTIAPLEERSTTGHTLTLDSTLRIQQIDEKKLTDAAVIQLTVLWLESVIF